MTSEDTEWLERAARAVEAPLRSGRVRLPWQRGWWVTARTDYQSRQPPRGFQVSEVPVHDARRRVARAPGRGRPIVILPGLYASLGEGLFASLAEGVHAATGRPVMLIEDRLAPATLSATAGRLVGVRTMGLEVAELARSCSEPPDVIALSFGGCVALAAGPVWHRVAAWSAVADPAALVREVQRSLIARAYFARVHRAAHRAAGLRAPSLVRLGAHLSADGPMLEAPAPTLLVHASDDPVAPLAPVLALTQQPRAHVSVADEREREQSADQRPRARVSVVALGGHLGFGVVAGLGVYWLPLLL